MPLLLLLGQSLLNPKQPNLLFLLSLVLMKLGFTHNLTNHNPYSHILSHHSLLQWWHSLSLLKSLSHFFTLSSSSITLIFFPHSHSLAHQLLPLLTIYSRSPSFLTLSFLQSHPYPLPSTLLHHSTPFMPQLMPSLP